LLGGRTPSRIFRVASLSHLIVRVFPQCVASAYPISSDLFGESANPPSACFRSYFPSRRAVRFRLITRLPPFFTAFNGVPVHLYLSFCDTLPFFGDHPLSHLNITAFFSPNIPPSTSAKPHQNCGAPLPSVPLCPVPFSRCFKVQHDVEPLSFSRAQVGPSFGFSALSFSSWRRGRHPLY